LVSKEFNDWRSSLKNSRPDVQAAVTVIGRRTAKRREWEKENAKGRADRFYLDLRGANLRGLDFRGLWFERTRFDGCQLEYAEFWHSHMSDSQFVGCNLSGASIWESDFKGAHFSRVKAFGTQIVRNDLSGVRMSFNDFTASTWNYTQLSHVYCLDSKFRGCSFHHVRAEMARFDSCSFDYANFSVASLNGVEIKGSVVGAEFDHSSLYGSNLSEAEGLTHQQVANAFEGDGVTKLPQTVQRPPDWPPHALTPSDAQARMKSNENRLVQEWNAAHDKQIQQTKA
jgi:uncharacterized protein YjbI with pentapeptide repeats